MKKIFSFMIAMVFAVVLFSQVTATSATYTIPRPDGLNEIHKVVTLIDNIDNKNFKIKNIEAVIVDGDLISKVSVVGTYNRDSSYYLYYNNNWNWFTGAQIQNAIAPIDTNLLHSLGRNLFYQDRSDSLFIPRTY